jgi:F-box/WD-40 domain protein 7
LICYNIQNELRIVSGGKDGKAREWSASSGDLEKQIAVCMGPIVEMLLLTGRKGPLVLSMSTKVH